MKVLPLSLTLIVAGLLSGYAVGRITQSTRESAAAQQIHAPNQAHESHNPIATPAAEESPGDVHAAKITIPTTAECLAGLQQILDESENGETTYRQRDRMLRRLIQGASPSTLQALILQTLSSKKERNYFVLSLLMQKLAISDMDACLQLVAQQRNPTLQWMAGGALARRYAEDPEGTLALLGSDAYAGNSQIRQSFLHGLAVDDPLQAIELYESDFGKTLPRHALFGVLNQWAQVDPQAAANYAVKLEDKGFHSGYLQSVLRDWVVQDRSSVLAWCNSLPVGPQRSVALQAFYGQWMQVQPENALAHLDTLPEGEEKQAIIRRSMSQLARVDPLLALPMIEQMPEGNDKRNAMHSLASRWAAKDAPAAVRYLAAQPANSSTTHLIERGLLRWAQTEPVAAMDFAQTLDAAQLFQVLPDLMRQWRGNDAAAASAWLARAQINPTLRALGAK